MQHQFLVIKNVLAVNIIVLTRVSSLALLGRSDPGTQHRLYKGQPNLPDPGHHLGHSVHGGAGEGVLHYVTHRPQLALLSTFQSLH